MKWNEYVDEVLVTAPDQSRDRQLTQAALGMVGEWREVERANHGDRVDEIGDCWWYLALAVDALNEMDRGWGSDPTNLARFCALGAAINFAEHVEGWAFQGERPVTAMLDELFIYDQALTAVGLAEGYDAPEVWARNIRKLRDRHGTSHPEEQ